MCESVWMCVCVRVWMCEGVFEGMCACITVCMRLDGFSGVVVWMCRYCVG